METSHFRFVGCLKVRSCLALDAISIKLLCLRGEMEVKQSVNGTYETLFDCC
jgi:hypothetical protein